jgi:CheY-like chemotaxis protein
LIFKGLYLAKDVAMEQKIRKTILAIDDAATQLSIFKSFLGSRYDLALVKSAPEALKLMDTRNFDLILLDIEMPDFSGFEFLHEIRKDPRFMTTPVIIVSSHADPEFLNSARNSSAVAVLTKPVKSKQLHEAIDKAFSLSPQKPFDI